MLIIALCVFALHKCNTLSPVQTGFKENFLWEILWNLDNLMGINFHNVNSNNK